MVVHTIMAVLLDHRSNMAPKVQDVLTKFGCIIKLRLGLHETDHICTEDGLILLYLTNDPEKNNELQAELTALEGVRVKTMEI